MSTNEVQEMTETANQVFAASHNIVEKMPDGSRKQIKDLVAEVSTALGVEPKKVVGFVDHYVHETKIAYVTRGKNGGLIKGTRPAKVVKQPRTKNVT